METRGSRAYLSFDHTGSGLVLRGIGGFEIRGPTARTSPAKPPSCPTAGCACGALRCQILTR